MGKNMYSLILSDEIVGAVDKLAHQRGTNRSNLINQVLAEHFSMKTPEKRSGEVLSLAREILSRNGQPALQPGQSGKTLTATSILAYKYNPTIIYTMTVSTGVKEYACTFKTYVRTQSKPLLSRLSMFYELWPQIEQVRPGRGYEARGSRFTRKLTAGCVGGIIDSEALAKAVAGYIILFDQAIRLFFEESDGLGAYKKILAIYGDSRENGDIALFQ